MTENQGDTTEVLRRLTWKVRHIAQSVLGGEYRSAFRGRGWEFDQVVRYEYGDDIRDIDWNVTARRGELYRKKFIEERELTIIIVFMDSISLQFGSAHRTKRNALLEIASLLSILAGWHRDRFGYLYAAPTTFDYHEPVRSLRGVRQVMGKLLSIPSPPLNMTSEVSVPWNQLVSMLPKHSILVCLGDFSWSHQPKEWERIRRYFELVGIRCDDPWECELPDWDPLPSYDPLSHTMQTLDFRSSSVRQAHATWKRERDALWHRLFPNPASRMTLMTTDSSMDALVKFFNKRDKKL